MLRKALTQLAVLTILDAMQGIDVNAEDSTGATPLADAIRCRHREEQAALRAAGGRLGTAEIAERLCVAAASNDLDTLNVRLHNRTQLLGCPTGWQWKRPMSLIFVTKNRPVGRES